VRVDDHELARACAEALYRDDLASQHLGITVSDVSPGHATATMRIAATMVNGHGIAHGGYVVLLADTAFAFACNTYNARTVAQGLDVSFLAPVRAGDELVAVAAERFRRGRSGIYDVTVSRDGEVVAELRGRSRTITGEVIGPQ
jgi:acyl-CoA thioesterase